MGTILAGSWGRHIPEAMIGNITSTWGARAIFRDHYIDLLPDRQSWEAADFSEDDSDPTSVEYEEKIAAIAPLRTWINKVGLPFLRKEAKTLYQDDNKTIAMDDGKFHIEANPQRSYGYLYIRAWEAK